MKPLAAKLNAPSKAGAITTATKMMFEDVIPINYVRIF
jgi:hypothetical protein